MLLRLVTNFEQGTVLASRPVEAGAACMTLLIYAAFVVICVAGVVWAIGILRGKR